MILFIIHWLLIPAQPLWLCFKYTKSFSFYSFFGGSMKLIYSSKIIKFNLFRMIIASLREFCSFEKKNWGLTPLIQLPIISLNSHAAPTIPSDTLPSHHSFTSASLGCFVLVFRRTLNVLEHPCSWSERAGVDCCSLQFHRTLVDF